MARNQKSVPTPTIKTTGGTARNFSSNKRKRTTNIVRAPVTQGGISRNSMPTMSASGASLRITHCEPFQSQGLTATGTLNTFTTAMIPAVMPYLNGIAGNFGKWRWVRCLVFYVPSCPTSTSGEMAMGQSFDRQDAAAFTYLQCASLNGGVSFPPWAGGPPFGPGSVSTFIDCSRFDKPRYAYTSITTFSALTSSDQNNYCPVTLAFASQGSTPAVATAGRFWCAYTIDLMDPIVAGINV